MLRLINVRDNQKFKIQRSTYDPVDNNVIIGWSDDIYKIVQRNGTSYIIESLTDGNSTDCPRTIPVKIQRLVRDCLRNLRRRKRAGLE